MNRTLIKERARGGMVDAADLKSDNTKKIPKISNEINVLSLLTFFGYTYTCLTHFLTRKTQQIFTFLKSDAGENVQVIMDINQQTNNLLHLKKSDGDNF
ncbi:MAG: hypothetical protein KAJ40_07835 [Alphaproteobacteria bacterium]|nr:hypothetical protein [Alphaproteobacteria bacterium]